MKNNKGFTLVEVLAVIIIIGIVMIIAVPAVSKYILRSDKAVYASNVSAYVESIRAKYEMREYGPLLKDNEIMIVPIKHIILEKGDSVNTPYGEYNFDKSYVLIVPERNTYQYYATVIDTTKVGLVNVAANEISDNMVQEKIETEIPLIESYGLVNATYTFKDKTYTRSDVRNIEGEDINSGNKVYVFKYIE